MKLYLLSLIQIVLSKKVVEISKYNKYGSNTCGIYSIEKEEYDLQKCYMDTLMHDNYGLSIKFEYCSISDDQVKILLYDNKQCSVNNNMVTKYLDNTMYRVNGGCYKFKCIEINDEDDGDFFDWLLGASILISIMLYCCLPCIILGICICLCVKICQQEQIINNNMAVQQPPQIILHNPNLPQHIEMVNRNTEGL